MHFISRRTNALPRLLAVGMLALVSCRSAEPPAPEIKVEPPWQPPTPTSPATDNLESERRRCEAQMRQVLESPGLPGAPEFDKRRLDILSRAKAEPLVLVETPRFSEQPAVSVAVKSFRTLLGRTQYPWDALKRLLPHFKKFPKDGREALLPQGYLYAATPEQAYSLVNLVGAEHLFGHDRIWVQRGELVMHAERKKGSYYFLDGPNEGERVRLLLLDRVGTGEIPARTLVRDLRTLRYRLKFNEARIRHVTESYIVADLKYGKLTVPSLLGTNGAEVSLLCDVLDPAHRPSLAEARRKSSRRQKAIRRLQSVIELQIEDQLPFDEPRHEYGHQLDGILRKNWRAAYFSGKNSFAYNGDRYRVFNRLKRPLLPEVCVDFLTDTFERLSGTWYQSKGKGIERKRIVGRLDYSQLSLVERGRLRRVPGFVRFAKAQTDAFEVLDVPKHQRIELGDRHVLREWLTRHREDFQPGDIVIIRGMTPWDSREMHYHSFFIYESDPLTGVPLAIVGNAGRPSVRYWEVEARRTPERTIWHRIRPKTAWLESLVDPLPLEPLPPSLSPRGNAG